VLQISESDLEHAQPEEAERVTFLGFVGKSTPALNTGGACDGHQSRYLADRRRRRRAEPGGSTFEARKVLEGGNRRSLRTPGRVTVRNFVIVVGDLRVTDSLRLGDFAIMMLCMHRCHSVTVTT
jgi:hypothetical protein